MKNVPLYTDLAFCLIFLPLMIFAFPVERWWGTYPLFFSSFVVWLYITYFLYKYFIIPQLFHSGRSRGYAVAFIVITLIVTFLFSSYEITSPFYHVRQQHGEMLSYPVWGVRQNKQAVWLHFII
ncbi:MAG: sensor histidine kinase, partial [Muribaculaceae bacterium]